MPGDHGDAVARHHALRITKAKSKRRNQKKETAKSRKGITIMDAILLYKAGEITPHGDPILCHFGPGCTIEPHPRSAESKTVITVHGARHTVKGHWEGIAKRAGYADVLKAAKIDSKKKKPEEPKKPEEAAQGNEGDSSSGGADEFPGI
jgi:hypothetical protein